ncbi:MAG: triose-phosphate isomerase [Firmicutes bacterium]|nr:triose-phosphate isomerase [Bacillota bacterium]
MNKTLRTPVIAGNWKMNLLPAGAKALAEELIPLTEGAQCEVVLCVPYIDLPTVLSSASGTNLKVGAQNCHWAEKGAFTGEIAAAMLKDIGVEYVIVGHSERRALFGDTNETVAQRTRAALDAGLKVILCVGEVKEERQQGITLEIVRLQTKIALAGVSAEELQQRVVVAYEPVWAIGTGLTATAEQANEVNKGIRDLLAELYDQDVADRTVIQYGGSMNASNAAELLAQPDVDGGLIGGASLKAADFAAIVAAAG